MFLDNYKNFPDSTISPRLLWEFDINLIDYAKMRNIVVQRVIERGWPKDWYAMLNIYGISGVTEAIKEIAFLNDVDMRFVSTQFDIPLKEMKCYIKKQSAPGHWSS